MGSLIVLLDIGVKAAAKFIQRVKTLHIKAYHPLILHGTEPAFNLGFSGWGIKLKVYILNGLLCSIGGFLFCLNTCAGFVEQAKGFEMEAIAGSVIGGTLLTGGVGNVFGSLFGVLIKGTIEAFVSFQGTLSSWWTKIIIAVILAFFIILQSILAMSKRGKK